MTEYGDLDAIVGKALDEGADTVSLHLTGVSLWPRSGPDRQIEHTFGVEIVYYTPYIAGGRRRKRHTFTIVCETHTQGLAYIVEWIEKSRNGHVYPVPRTETVA